MWTVDGESAGYDEIVSALAERIPREDFDTWIDEAYGGIELFGKWFPASEVFKAVLKPDQADECIRLLAERYMDEAVHHERYDMLGEMGIRFIEIMRGNGYGHI